MILVINFSSARSSGTINYCDGFINSVLHGSNCDTLIFLLPADLFYKFQSQGQEKIRFFSSIFFKYTITRIFWEQFILPLMLKRWKASALFSAFDITTFLTFIPILLGVRNPMPLHQDKGWKSNFIWKALRAKLQRKVAFLSILKARMIFYPTHYAAQALGGAFNVPESKIKVINHGVDLDRWGIHQSISEVMNSYGLIPKRYFIFVSMLYYYKRPDFLIRAFSINVEHFRSKGFQVVIIGGAPDDAYFQSLKSLVAMLGVDDDIKLLGYVPKNHLPSLYSGARAFVLPTTLETFGQPFVEAMASSLPVIAANLPFAREVCGDAALYFDSEDIQRLAFLMKQVCDDDSLALDLSCKATQRSKDYSWSKESKQTIDLLRCIASKI